MKKIIAILLLFLFLPVSALADLQVHFLDVGQGDCTIIVCDGEAMVIDGGPRSSSNYVYGYIRRTLKLRQIEYVISTHPHLDHVYGLSSVLNAAPVDLLLTPVLEWDSKAFSYMLKYAEKQGTPISVPQEGDTLQLGSATVTILHCWPEAIEYGRTNDSSIVTRIDYGNTSFIITGDAEDWSEYMMIDSGMNLKADVLRVAHHGSNTASTMEFLKAVQPKYAVISVGKLKTQGLSPKYIKNIHGCLHRALDMAVKVEYIEKNYTSVCSIPKGAPEEVNPLTEDEQKKLFRAMKGEEHEYLFLTDIFTGMRCGELIGLTWDCIDFERGIITIRRQIVQIRERHAIYEWGTLKNGKTRIIAPAPFVMDVLKKQKEKQQKMITEAGSLWRIEKGFENLVFTHKDGSHLSQPTVWKQFQKLLQKAGLEHHRVHDLRHTFAVNSLRAGDDIKTLQENMGHFSAAFTLDRYGHVTEEMRKASSQRMQAFIDNMTGNSNDRNGAENATKT